MSDLFKSEGEWSPEAFLLISGSLTTTLSLYGSLRLRWLCKQSCLTSLLSFWLDDQWFPSGSRFIQIVLKLFSSLECDRVHVVFILFSSSTLPSSSPIIICLLFSLSTFIPLSFFFRPLFFTPSLIQKHILFYPAHLAAHFFAPSFKNMYDKHHILGGN